MKRLLLNTFLFAMVSTMMVACSKEEVKPFSNGPAGNSIMNLRDGSTGNGTDVVDPSTVTDTNESTTNSEETDVDGDGITDGGNSSDYDSKASKKKKNP